MKVLVKSKSIRKTVNRVFISLKLTLIILISLFVLLLLFLDDYITQAITFLMIWLGIYLSLTYINQMNKIKKDLDLLDTIDKIFSSDKHLILRSLDGWGIRVDESEVEIGWSQDRTYYYISKPIKNPLMIIWEGGNSKLYSEDSRIIENKHLFEKLSNCVIISACEFGKDRLYFTFNENIKNDDIYSALTITKKLNKIHEIDNFEYRDSKVPIEWRDTIWKKSYKVPKKYAQGDINNIVLDDKSYDEKMVTITIALISIFTSSILIRLLMPASEFESVLISILIFIFVVTPALLILSLSSIRKRKKQLATKLDYISNI